MDSGKVCEFISVSILEISFLYLHLLHFFIQYDFYSPSDWLVRPRDISIFGLLLSRETTYSFGRAKSSLKLMTKLIIFVTLMVRQKLIQKLNILASIFARQ